MGLAAYEAGETLQDIVNDCVRLANCPDLAFDPATKAEPIAGEISRAPAYRWLLDIIRNLYLEHDWPFAIKARTLLQISPICLQLPEDFWRVAYTNPLYALIAGVGRWSLEHITRPQFFDNPSLANNATERPRTFYISRPDALIYLNPPPDQTYVYELHYFQLIPELTDVLEVPRFPYRDYLRASLLVRCYDDQSDTRAMAARLDMMEIWKRIRQAIWDFREDPEQMPNTMLDPQIFRRVDYDG